MNMYRDRNVIICLNNIYEKKKKTFFRPTNYISLELLLLLKNRYSLTACRKYIGQVKNSFGLGITNLVPVQFKPYSLNPLLYPFTKRSDRC